MSPFNLAHCEPAVEKFVIIEKTLEAIIEFVKDITTLFSQRFYRPHSALAFVGDHSDRGLHRFQFGQFCFQGFKLLSFSLRLFLNPLHLFRSY